jgi:hypothetical protein
MDKGKLAPTSAHIQKKYFGEVRVIAETKAAVMADGGFRCSSASARVILL